MNSPTKRFSSRVDFYVRSRPKYPAALLRFFQSDLSLSPAQTVADIGSGTGFLTELFVHNGNPTYAVEPNDEMRSAAEQSLSQWPNFHSINATAEATTLQDSSIDLITAGQAFHWFKWELAAAEFRRILKPGGIVALIWNERLPEASPFMKDYEQLIQKYSRKGETCHGRMLEGNGEGDITQFFTALGSQHEMKEFTNPQILDRDGLVDRVTSSSYLPLPSDANYQEMVNTLTTMFDVHQQNQTVQILHDTRVYFGRSSG